MSKGETRKVPKENGVYNAWVLLHPAEDLPGAWVAHALEFDVITHGDSPDAAVTMVAEAVSMVLEDDLADGCDPYLRRAPASYWEQLAFILEHGARMPMSELLEKARACDSSTPCYLAISMFFASKRKASEVPIPPYRTPLAVASSAHA